MKIYTKVVINMNSNEILEKEFYEYDGVIAQCKGGTQNVTQTQTSEPWEGAAGLARSVVGPGGLGDWYTNYAAGLAPEWSQYLANPWVAGFTPEQNTAFELTRQIGLDPSYLMRNYSTIQGNLDPGRSQAMEQEVLNAYNKTIAPTIYGQMLSPETNPYLEQYAQAATRPIEQNFMTSIAPAIKSQAQAAGRYGSGAYADIMSQSIGDVAQRMGDVRASIYAPAYESERQRQMTAAQVPINVYDTQKQLELLSMPQQLDLMNQVFKQIGMVAGVGEEKQKMSQALLEEQQNKFMSKLYDPYNLIASLGNLAFTGGQTGGTTTTQTPYYTPGFAQNLMGNAGTAGTLALLAQQMGLI